MVSPIALAGVFATLVAVAWAGIAAWKPWAERWNLLDIPNARSSHSKPTPRAGGVPLALITITAIAASGAIFDPPTWTLAIAAAAIALTGFIDDARSLSWQIRFAVQIAAALLVIWPIGPIDTVGPFALGILAIPLTVIWIAGLTNAYNFMDGIDGIAAIQAIVAAAGWVAIAWLQRDPVVTITATAIAATSIAFLRHNYPPATIFMGDVGSGFLGFLFAAITVRIARQEPSAAIIGGLFLWPFLFDTITTFFKRLVRRENVVAAHRSHIYQRLVIAGASHAYVSATYGVLAAICTSTGLAYHAGYAGPVAPAVVAAGVALYLLAAVRRLERRRPVES